MLFCKTSNVVNASENVGGIFPPFKENYFALWGEMLMMIWIDETGKRSEPFFLTWKNPQKSISFILLYSAIGVNNLGGGALKFPPFIQHHHFADRHHRAHHIYSQGCDDMNGHKTSRKNRKLIVLPYKNEIALFNRCGVLFHRML